MSGEINCILTKGLVPFVERTVGPEGLATLLRAAGHPREYLTAEYNWIPLTLADQLVRLAMKLMNEPDQDRWGRRFADDFMEWKPSREERGWVGAYTMSLGSPRAVYADTTNMLLHQGWARFEILSMGRRRAVFRLTPNAGVAMPRWLCTWTRVCYERFPTNWQLPRAHVSEYRCAARGDECCEWEVRWKNPSFGARRTPRDHDRAGLADDGRAHRAAGSLRRGARLRALPARSAQALSEAPEGPGRRDRLLESRAGKEVP